MDRRLKLSLVAAFLGTVTVCLGGYMTRGTWLRMAAESLVCASSEEASDVILIEHVAINYLLFVRAKQLQASGRASTVLIPILASSEAGEGYLVSLRIVDIMCEISKLSSCTTFLVPASEPISLNVAHRSAEEIKSRGIRSVLLVTDGFRSRRATEVFSSVLLPLGVTVRCQPVFGSRTPANWSNSTHGMQEVGLQLAKLWYYKIVALPR